MRTDKDLWINNVQEFAEIADNNNINAWYLLIGKKVSLISEKVMRSNGQNEERRYSQGEINQISFSKKLNISLRVNYGNSFFIVYQKTDFIKLFNSIITPISHEMIINYKAQPKTRKEQLKEEYQEHIRRRQKEKIKQQQLEFIAREEKQEKERQVQEERIKKRQVEFKAREEQLEKERQQRIQHEQKKQALLSRIRECFKTNFLNADYLHKTECSEYISPQEYRQEKLQYVQSWVKQHLGKEPDSEQAEAIGTVENYVQVIARAGSGKTSTLVNRALFLQKHCGVPPNEMLLLAFNRKAADEIQERLSHQLKSAIPHVMTFHALAYALVHPEEDLLFDQSGRQQSKSRALQSVIDDHLRHPVYYNRIRTLMMAKFRQDWEQIVQGGYDQQDPEKILDYRRSLPKEGLDGKYYKSFGEKAIANFLFEHNLKYKEHNLKYKYERNFTWSGINYRPDFTIFKSANQGIIIEYFGMKGNLDYDDMSQQKRQFWQSQHNWQFLEFNPYHFKDGEENFCELLKRSLERLGLICNKLNEEEIWLQVKDRAVDRFTKTMVQFVQRCRQLSLKSEDLEYKIYNHSCINEIEEQFLELGQIFYKAYLDKLKATGEEDFDGLMQRSAELIASGKTNFKRKSGSGDLKKLRYIFIDEYQDFSDLFYRLVKAIRQQNSQALFFCVGDDWQAINGFAGSDLSFYENFEKYFSNSKKLDISTNYRSNSSIVETSNRLMQGFGKPAIAEKKELGTVKRVDFDKFNPTQKEIEDFPGDNITPAVLRLVNKATQENKNVVLLSRNNNLHWYINGKNDPCSFLKLIQSRLPKNRRDKVSISTTHKYKGLEKAVVIILDAIPRCYPLIHPDWIFTQIFENNLDQIIDEERRLFYVALTRAVEQLFIITESNNSSPFLQRFDFLDEVSWSDYPPLVDETNKSITVQVRNQEGKGSNPTYKIKTFLSSEGYKWNSIKGLWSQTISAKNFTFDNFFSQSLWCPNANEIEVRFYDDFEKEIGVYHVNEGKWVCVTDNLSQSVLQSSETLKKLDEIPF